MSEWCDAYHIRYSSKGMDMETDVKTEIAFQDVSCKKINAIVILFITLCRVEGHQLGVLSARGAIRGITGCLRAALDA